MQRASKNTTLQLPSKSYYPQKSIEYLSFHFIFFSLVHPLLLLMSVLAIGGCGIRCIERNLIFLPLYLASFFLYLRWRKVSLMALRCHSGDPRCRFILPRLFYISSPPVFFYSDFFLFFSHLFDAWQFQFFSVLSLKFFFEVSGCNLFHRV